MKLSTCVGGGRVFSPQPVAFYIQQIKPEIQIHGGCNWMLQVTLFFHSIKPSYSGTKLKEHPVECGHFLSPHFVIATRDSDDKAGNVLLWNFKQTKY
jgi:hypothetical protein